MEINKFLINKGFLKVSDGHKIYWEDWGNPQVKTPIFYLHGGPGSGFSDKNKLLFDPTKQRVIFHDQRGSGRSTPFASIKNNTTPDLIADINELRDHLKINSINLVGGSWGSTLSLAYAINNPKTVNKMLLWGIYLGRKEDNDFIYVDAVKHYPEVHQRFMSLVPKAQQNNVIDFYFKKFKSKDRKERQKFIKEWTLYERTLLELDPNIEKFILEADEQDPETMDAAIIEPHYFINNCFLSPNYILKNASSIAHIPTIIVHGRFDFVCSPLGANLLQSAIGENAILHIAQGAHRADPTIREIIKAYSRVFLL